MDISLTARDGTETSGMVATITARQLAAFRSFAAAHEERCGEAIIAPAGRSFAAYDFEARVCPLALATLAKLFDFASDMIGVIDDAQVRGRLIRFERDDKGGVLRARVSANPDALFEMRSRA